FTEEKLGQAEKTELDAHLENLLSKAECTKIWTEKIMKQTEVLLQPNPSKTLDFSALRFASQGPTYVEQSVYTVFRNGRSNLFGVFMAVMCSLSLTYALKQLNSARLEGDNIMVNFSYMLNFLHVKWLKSEQELRITQSEFDRQAEITRLLLEGISSTHAHHLRCLNDFVEAQMTYYAQCYQY
ncbi:hypothetical protein A6R68_01752, partial [Neotoma lepida]